jgi:uncharacterized coiled-coil DUF342 family protein
VKERDNARKKVVDLRKKLDELENDFETCRNKYELYVSLTTTLTQKEDEVNMMMPEKDDLLAKRKALKPEGEGN